MGAVGMKHINLIVNCELERGKRKLAYLRRGERLENIE
jgi:hypothetical protein